MHCTMVVDFVVVLLLLALDRLVNIPASAGGSLTNVPVTCWPSETVFLEPALAFHYVRHLYLWHCYGSPAVMPTSG
jgi:hypothetical protein